MACPHLKQIVVNIQQGLIHKGYAVFGFSEDWFGLEWRWDRDSLSKKHAFDFWSIPEPHCDK